MPQKLSEESDESLKRRGLIRSKEWPYVIGILPRSTPTTTTRLQNALHNQQAQEEEIRRYQAAQEADRARQDEGYRRYEEREKAEQLKSPAVQDCTFAKSISVVSGQVCHPDGQAPFEGLGNYGTYAVLSTSEAITSAGTPLQLIGGSTTALTLAGRVGGSLSLGLSGSAVSAGVVAGGIAGSVAMLWPNTFASDTAFYSIEEFANLAVANIGVRVNVKHLPGESVSAFGVYTGNNSAWRSVPVIAATVRGDQLVADLGDGVELIWTPAVDTSRLLGIPALEGAPQLPAVFVFPEAEQAEQRYDHPANPPDFRDAIIWFPSQPQILPVYISLNVRGAPGVVTGVGQDVTGIWLAGAGVGLGSPVPTRIADQLRGLEFSSFDAFRKAFWQAIAADPELSRQFKSRNLSDMAKGFAPAAPKSEHVGKRISFELHHVELIKDGGAVYDVDNLRAVTSKHHIDIHRGMK
ncbi:S-type pyocin domain-containing protein [Pseudomonas alkylphenolica]|uniref:S-type Pyocin n=1 Tax=Pseudomonas alkylphenolica TaxID=237609 RepID=A0A077F9G4_9PSED|nr:S-type pyocin domain-containing protein [Pseudomonas alkylphenolica]AIL61983.1 S-type Pyocin [Pseudomonas alkylphenolica]